MQRQRDFRRDVADEDHSTPFAHAVNGGSYRGINANRLRRNVNAGSVRGLQNLLLKIRAREEYVGGVLALMEDKRGIQKKFEYIGSGRVMLVYELPLNEIVLDFYDRLKTVSRGYASLDYHLSGFRISPMVRLDILIAGEEVDALSMIVHRDYAYERGKLLISRMRKLIPRQMFEIALQAAIGTKIVARESISALRKNVLAKCYGGDISRKRKLLEKQKEGKKRMKRVGRVDIPQEAFLAVLKVGDTSDDD